MKKIKLNHDMIVYNYQQTYLGKKLLFTLGFAIFACLLLGVWASINDISFLLPLVIVLIGGTTLWVSIAYLGSYWKLKKGNYTVITDTLCKIEEWKRNPYPARRKDATYSFIKSGSCPITLDGLTQDASHEDPDIDRTVEVGDTYYLVCVNNKVVGMYNQRIFEYNV